MKNSETKNGMRKDDDQSDVLGNVDDGGGGGGNDDDTKTSDVLEMADASPEASSPEPDSNFKTESALKDEDSGLMNGVVGGALENGVVGGDGADDDFDDIALVSETGAGVGRDDGARRSGALPDVVDVGKVSVKGAPANDGDGGCAEFVRSSTLLLYVGHFLASWGDRMWSFAVAVFLIGLQDDSLRLPAIYGVSVGITALLFGALVGDWVDETPRMRTVVTALVVQNLAVAACAGVVMATLFLDSELRDVPGSREAVLAASGEATIIAIACVANLASTAIKIAIQKDWIVVIAGGADNLARMNSVTRAIDLTAKILAPVLTGVVMSTAGHFVGAAFIAAWNVVSLGFEYSILRKVFVDNPMLKIKAAKPNEEKESEKPFLSPENDAAGKGFDAGRGQEAPAQTSPLGRARRGLQRLFRGWSIFMHHVVRDAGLGLAFLYMTVLGFDSITVGYAYTQGICDSILGTLMASGAIVGILGTVSYPALRRRFGLERAGLYASAMQISCLSLCVVAVFLPGSPFVFLAGQGETDGPAHNETTATIPSTLFNDSTSLSPTESSSASLLGIRSPVARCDADADRNYLSIAVMMVGIIAARFGLWNLDLTITQILQEEVAEAERGIVNGVQDSLCFLFDMIKFVLVIFVPDPHHFGFLVFLSFIFVVTGGCLYASYARRSRGGSILLKEACCCGDHEDAITQQRVVHLEALDKKEVNQESVVV